MSKTIATLSRWGPDGPLIEEPLLPDLFPRQEPPQGFLGM